MIQQELFPGFHVYFVYLRSVSFEGSLCNQDANASFEVAGFVEKPDLADAPSRLAVVGRYVFSNKIFDYLANTTASVGGEIQLTDAIDALISEYGVKVTTMVGDSYDAGDMRSYMQSFIYFATQQLAADG